MDTRCQYLSFISGLTVKMRREKNVNVFDFYLPSNQIQVKTIFNYKKAKVFAEGISIGKKMI